MTITRTLLKRTLRDVESIDVFAAVDDDALAEFSPRDEGEGYGFVYWGRAADGAFDSKGALVRPLPMWWGASRAELQMAFARRNLVVRIEESKKQRDDYAEHGTLVLSPASEGATSDLIELIEVFAALGKRKVLAFPCAGSTQSAGWEIVAERERSPEQTAVFWHEQSHDAFDAFGRLTGKLHLHWRGDAGRVCDALVEAGFVVDRPKSDQQSIVVRPTGSEAPDIERFADALAANPAPVAAKPARKAKAPAGPFAALHRYRGPDRTKPIHRLRFDPSGTWLVVAQSPDRGGPDHLLSRVDIATGERQRTFAPKCDAWECGGIDFLPDGRMVFSLQDSGARVLVWEPDRDVEREVAYDEYSPLTSVSLSSIDAAGEILALVTGTGVALRTISKPGAAVWPERARVGGPPPSTYPIALVSPDGQHVLWGEYGGSQIRWVAVAGGRTVWKQEPTHNGGALDQLCFDPSGEHLVVLCRLSGWSATAQWLQSYALAKGKPAHAALQKASQGVTTFAFHPDGKRVAIGKLDGELVLLAYPGGELLASQKVFEKKGRVTAIAFDPAGARMAVGSEKGEIAVLAVPAPE
ncbi:WD40 repeat domain-containing protein [Nannocystis bainbridge]|uniref:WD40 repeat domain-containing protein n=1 Tax=Nannocystis bainbridge TaxID=2995303 RepID=A0ABT5DVV8_9BACT|nr:WD40 repeat domain-containing protein [Nannocystis bainbridge]MDC0717772.1 WD40 repeat domain-containing protein [Nannocystis bainbridge]